MGTAGIRPLWVVLIWVLSVVAADQFTKWLVISSFAYNELRPVLPGFFNLTFLANTGAAFGMLAGENTMWRQVFFIGVAFFALIVLVFAYRHYRNDHPLYVHSVGMIAGGALGNLIDRLRFGAVIDFLDFHVGHYHWPAFNVADSAITVGVACFILAGILSPRKNLFNEK